MDRHITCQSESCARLGYRFYLVTAQQSVRVERVDHLLANGRGKVKPTVSAIRKGCIVALPIRERIGEHGLSWEPPLASTRRCERTPLAESPCFGGHDAAPLTVPPTSTHSSSFSFISTSPTVTDSDEFSEPEATSTSNAPDELMRCDHEVLAALLAEMASRATAYRV